MPQEDPGTAARVNPPRAVAERSIDLQDFRALRTHKRLARLDEVKAKLERRGQKRQRTLPRASRPFTVETNELTDLQGLLERLKGLEPSTFCMASRRSSQLSYSRKSSASIATAGRSPWPVREACGPSACCGPRPPSGPCGRGRRRPSRRRGRGGRRSRCDVPSSRA